MAAATLNIEIEKGATFARTVTYTDDTQTPIDITGATIRAKFRIRAQDSAGYDFTATITDSVNGQFDWVMNATITATLPGGTGVYEVDVINSDGTVDRILTGKASVTNFIGRADS